LIPTVIEQNGQLTCQGTVELGGRSRIAFPTCLKRNFTILSL
jgi:hypothetical protein